MSGRTFHAEGLA